MQEGPKEAMLLTHRRKCDIEWKVFFFQVMERWRDVCPQDFPAKFSVLGSHGRTVPSVVFLLCREMKGARLEVWHEVKGQRSELSTLVDTGHLLMVCSLGFWGKMPWGKKPLLHFIVRIKCKSLCFLSA